MDMTRDYLMSLAPGLIGKLRRSRRSRTFGSYLLGISFVIWSDVL